MYRVVQQTGDGVQVPQLVLNRLGNPCANEAAFQVALYCLQQGGGDPAQAAQDLHLKPQMVREAFTFWEGAGLLCPEINTDDVDENLLVPRTRERLSTREVVAASRKDPVLPELLRELQRIFGGVLSQGEMDIFATLYCKDSMPADLILVCSKYCAAQGKTGARYIEKKLLAWHKNGICDVMAADSFLKLEGEREKREKKVARLFGITAADLTLSEKKKIAAWFEEYGFDKEMIEAARRTAGDKCDEIAYVGGILKKWNAKGYRTPREVQQSGEVSNLRSEGTRKRTAPEDDVLLNLRGYVPLYNEDKP